MIGDADRGERSDRGGGRGVTVAVCSRDRPDELAACLAAVQAVLTAADELLVVDSASVTDRTAEVAAAAGARVVREPEPGLSRARNAALRAAERDVVAYTDDDCRPGPAWTSAVAAAFGADANLGFVTGRVLGEGGGAPVVVLADTEARTFDPTTPLEGLGHGANMAVRVAAARVVGGFDELLGAGARFRAGEDTDMFRRLLHAGWHGRYEPAAVVTHRQWRSRRQALGAAYGYGVGFGAVAAKARVEGAGGGLYRRGIGPAGLGHAVRDLRSGYPFGSAVCLCWTAGVMAGHARAARLHVRDGRLGARIRLR